MLLRSSSAPILKSWISSNYINTNTNSSPNSINELTLTLFRTNSISTFTTPSPPSSPNYAAYANPSKRAAYLPLPESDIRDPPHPKTSSLQRLFSSSGLDEAVSAAEDGAGGDVSGDDGDRMNGGDGHGGGGGYNGFNDISNNNNNNDNNEYGSTEEYYQKMIKADPGNSLLLGNYATFLKDVRGNLAKAEEYCERAILGSPNDANMLSLYANIIWEHRRDAQRVNSYFDQAIKTAPDDCYIQASYAKFLWDVEEEELEEEESQDSTVGNPSPSPLHFLEITSHRTPSLL